MELLQDASQILTAIVLAALFLPMIGHAVVAIASALFGRRDE